MKVLAFYDKKDKLGEHLKEREDTRVISNDWDFSHSNFEFKVKECLVVIFHYTFDGHPEYVRSFLRGKLLKRDENGHYKYWQLGNICSGKPLVIATGSIRQAKAELDEIISEQECKVHKLCFWERNEKYVEERLEPYLFEEKFEYLVSGRISWAYEHSLEILCCCATPEGFEDAEDELSKLDKYIFEESQARLGGKREEITKLFDKAKANLQVLKEVAHELENSLDIFDKHYVNSLIGLREDLFALVNACEKIGIK